MIVETVDQKVDNFIRGLETPTRTKVGRMVDLLERFGYLVSMPYSKKISDTIFELRIRGQQEVRIFYTFYDNRAWLFHGFIKKTQKTPFREITTAESKLQALTKK